MTFSVSSFATALGSGTRSNLFEVSIALTNLGATAPTTFAALAKATSIPASTVGLIEVPHLGGRRLKVAGDRTFAEWTVTLMSDEAFKLRTALEDYQNTLVTLAGEVVTGSTGSGITIGNRGTGNRATVVVKQLGDDSTVLRTYTLVNAFASDISALDLSYDTRDAIQEFTVTWVYDYYTIA